MTVLLQWALMSNPGISDLSMFTSRQEVPPTVTLPSKHRWMKFKEIIEKFVSSHKILLTEDFNASLHRQENCRRDRMLKSFVEEHYLFLPDDYLVQPTYMHESTSASCLIEYWFVRPVERESISIGSQCTGNLSDHVEVVLHIDSYPDSSDVDSSSTEPKTCQSQSNNNKSKIGWDKCDLQLYSDILQTGLQRIED